MRCTHPSQSRQHRGCSAQDSSVRAGGLLLPEERVVSDAVAVYGWRYESAEVTYENPFGAPIVPPGVELPGGVPGPAVLPGGATPTGGVAGDATSPDVTATSHRWAKAIGKTPIIVRDGRVIAGSGTRNPIRDAAVVVFPGCVGRPRGPDDASPAAGPGGGQRRGRRPGHRGRQFTRLLNEAVNLVARGRIPSVAEVAQSAGVSRATAYRYFPSRSKLVSAVIAEALAQVCLQRGDFLPLSLQGVVVGEVQVDLDERDVAQEDDAGSSVRSTWVSNLL